MASIPSAKARVSGVAVVLTGATCKRPSRSSTPSSSPRSSRREKRFSRRSSSPARPASHSSAVAGSFSPIMTAGNGVRRQQVAVEAAVAGRAFDPDIARAQLVAQRRENRRLV